MPVTPPDVVESSSVPAVEEEADPALGGASGGTVPVEEVLDQKDIPTPASPPS